MSKIGDLIASLFIIGLWFLAGYLLAQVMPSELAAAIVILVWLHK